MATPRDELSVMYGDDPYSFAPYPLEELDSRVGRDPKIESLPTSDSDASYDKAFIESKCAACGRNQGDKGACRACSKLIRDRFGKDTRELPERALMQMWWAAQEEKEARATGKIESDIKLDRIKRRRELRRERRKEKI